MMVFTLEIGVSWDPCFPYYVYTLLFHDIYLSIFFNCNYLDYHNDKKMKAFSNLFSDLYMTFSQEIRSFRVNYL